MPDYITPEGMSRLRKRFQLLNDVERPQVVRQIVQAREMGDLSENAEYHAARERQRRIDDEMNHLRSRLGKLQVIDPASVPKDAVRFGALVECRELATDEVLCFRLVGVDETEDWEEGITRVSVASPIGRAMIGVRPGQTFTVKAPVGDRVFEVLSIT